MDYEGRIFRPPSEARSLLLQITVGCSHNRCTYCDMYRDKRFRPKKFDQVLADIEEAASQGPQHKRIFLCDGDALILPTKRLLPILEAIKQHLPWIERVGTYGDTRSIGRKSVSELKELRELGLGIVYHGAETGSDEVMMAIDKGATQKECIESAQRLREAKIVHSVMVLLGIAGKDHSQLHAEETAQMLTEMDPEYVGALTTTLVPGTPLAGSAQRGFFQLPSKFRMLEELRTIVAESEFSNCRFSSNHASNYLPVRAELPRHKSELVAMLDEVLSRRDPGLLKPEWQRGL